MNTVKLYNTDPYLKSSVSKIADANHSVGGFLLVLDKTVFFPVGGGQSCDKGTINGFEVTSVYENEGLIFHQVQCNNSNIVWNIGDEVICHIDWNHRFLNMQRHCGEHILSGIFYREYGGVNRGFHMGEDYMTIDISLEENHEYDTLTFDMSLHAEALANQVIWSNAPVITRHFEAAKDAQGLPLRKALTIEKDISIVCVGDINDSSDCVACCGTHPSTAGQVGLVKLLKVESYKGMFRVYCDAGANAMKLFDKYHGLITALNNKYSASTADLMEKIAAQDDKNKAVRSELYILKQSVIKDRIASLEADLAAMKSGSTKAVAASAKADSAAHSKFLICEYDDMKLDDLLNIGRPLIPVLDRLLLIISRPDKTVLLFSNGKPDCGKLVKENASIYQGKGGGNNTNARALFPKVESIDTFIDLLDKHLR